MSIDKILVVFFAGLGAAITLGSFAGNFWDPGFLKFPILQWGFLVGWGGLGVLMLAGGLLWAAKRQRIIANGRAAEGVVVSQRITVRFSSTKLSDRPMFDDLPRVYKSFYPIVEFRTESGQTVRFESRMDTWGDKDLDVGTKVRVYYDPAKPSEAFIGRKDQMWLGPGSLAVAGLLLVLCGVAGYLKGGKVIANYVAAARSPEAVAAQFESERLVPYNYKVKIRGIIAATQRLPMDDGPPIYVYICKGKRPGAKAEEEFQTSFYPFKLDESFVGRAVDIYLDPEEPNRYMVPSAALLKEQVEKKR